MPATCCLLTQLFISTIIHIQGAVYDCDFNQQLGMGIVGKTVGSDESSRKQKLSVFDIESLGDLEKYSVRTDNHCFGCTAGSGSSCQGATA